eukprot:gnl/MRDRNA2_/MRDRNA2_87648_c0_seq1.p1 gnl/MRDRNA2_/MRDRNA2_87648_c0~~gnl/MRDRNA2_/MRDRNA2_87648_c0_seq1.p1  ORF type:complete len:348 (-),score=77.36 gnl/MRDRNA2_/MRDRNA2_87648_c0_seq1:267-1310(-)
MRSAIVFLAFISEAHAGPALGNPGLKGGRNQAAAAQFRPPMYQGSAAQFRPPMYQGAASQFTVPQQRSVVAYGEKEDAQAWIANWKAKQGGGGASVGDMEGKNVLGGDLESCSASEDCTYNAESPQICVGLAPRVREGGKDRLFFSDARSFELTPPEGQFKWKPEYVGQCVPFFEFGSDSFMKGLRFGNNDLVPKCQSIPSSVFLSEYSLDLWQNCGMEAKEYKYYSPSSSKATSDGTSVTKKDPFYIKKPSFGEEQPDMMSPKCARFRQGIERLALLCSDQADASQLAAMNGMKAAMEGAYSVETTSSVTGVAAVALVFFLVGSAVSFAMARQRRSATEGDEKLIA